MDGERAARGTMRQVGPLAEPFQEGFLPGKPAAVLVFEARRCGLCGASLEGTKLTCRMVSPHGAGASMIVCRICHRAALGEGYRPAE